MYKRQSLSVQTLLVYLFLMWVGGGSQSTAGGVKVNAFAVVVLNLVAGLNRKTILCRTLPLVQCHAIRLQDSELRPQKHLLSHHLPWTVIHRPPDVYKRQFVMCVISIFIIMYVSCMCYPLPKK